MRCGVISDTHGSVAAWRNARAEVFQGVDVILHAGDVFYHGTRNPFPNGYDTLELAAEINACPIPVIIARGNCDSEVDQMVCNIPIQDPFAKLQCGDHAIIVQHWQRGGPAELDDLIDRFRPRVFITGHTHSTVLSVQGETLIVNPGSPSLTKRSDGKKTVATLELDHDGSVTARLIDLETGDELEELGLPPSKESAR